LGALRPGRAFQFRPVVPPHAIRILKKIAAVGVVGRAEEQRIRLGNRDALRRSLHRADGETALGDFRVRGQRLNRGRGENDGRRVVQQGGRVFGVFAHQNHLEASNLRRRGNRRGLGRLQTNAVRREGHAGLEGHGFAVYGQPQAVGDFSVAQRPAQIAHRLLKGALEMVQVLRRDPKAVHENGFGIGGHEAPPAENYSAFLGRPWDIPRLSRGIRGLIRRPSTGKQIPRLIPESARKGAPVLGFFSEYAHGRARFRGLFRIQSGDLSPDGRSVGMTIPPNCLRSDSPLPKATCKTPRLR
jgi:hypothetical protein